MSRLIKSSKFWLAIMDAVIATITFFMTLFLKPEMVEEALVLIGIWQPVIIMVIKGYTDEDVALKSTPDLILDYDDIPESPAEPK